MGRILRSITHRGHRHQRPLAPSNRKAEKIIPKLWTLPWLRDSGGSAGEAKASRGEDQVVDTPAQTCFKQTKGKKGKTGGNNGGGRTDTERSSM